MTTTPNDLSDETLGSLSLGEDLAPSDATRDAIRKAVMADLEPAEVLSVKRRAAYVFGAGLASAALVVVSYGAAGVHGLARHAVATVVAGVVAVLAALAIGGSFTPQMQERLGRSSRTLLVASIVVAWTLYVFSGMTDQALGTALAGAAIGCCVRSLGAGLVGFAAFMYIWRRTDPWTPRISGALIGGCAGAIASAGVGIPCAAEHGGHLLVGHWLAVPLLALFGAAIARRVLAP